MTKRNRTWLLLALAATLPWMAAWAGDPNEFCVAYYEDMESGAPGWSFGLRTEAQAKIADPPGPSTWHLADQTCNGISLGDTMLVSNGNYGPTCTPDSSRDYSQAMSPPIHLPKDALVVLEFDALSFDEGGFCMTSSAYDRKDVGVSLDGGITYVRLNNCEALTDGTGGRSRISYDVSSFSGHTVQFIWIYDTVDSNQGHTFALDNVEINTNRCREPSCGDGILDEGQTCDPPGEPFGAPDVCREDCTFCGDGNLDPQNGELCDDGNNIDGDGCSSTCLLDGSGCQIFVDDMESGGTMWSPAMLVPGRERDEDAEKIADPPGPPTWHAATTSCQGDELGSMMMVSNGNYGPDCQPGSSRESSMIVGPKMVLPDTELVTLEFDSLSFDEGGFCISSSAFDKKDVGISTDGGATYTRINDCTALGDGTGQLIHNSFDISAWAGQEVQFIFGYETVDSGKGHTFAVDNVRVSGDTCGTISVSVGSAAFKKFYRTTVVNEAKQFPVVIVGPANRTSTDPGLVRVDNVTPTSFDARFQEWEYLDSFHSEENAPYIHMAAGRRVLANGSIWEAGTFSLSGLDNSAAIQFLAPFPSAPKLFLTVQTENDLAPVIARLESVTRNGFSARLMEEEGQGDHHEEETIGYLAVYGPTSGTLPVSSMSTPYLLQELEVDHQFTPILGWNIRIEEERSADDEIVHGRETVDALVIGGHLFAQDRTAGTSDPFALRRIDPDPYAGVEWGVIHGIDHEWQTIPFSKEYVDPIVVVRPSSTVGTQAGVARLRNVNHRSFDLHFEEWDYLDGVHYKENFFYMVAESGSSHVAGLAVKAGKTATSRTLSPTGWQRVEFPKAFAGTPNVFTSPQTANDEATVTTRVRRRDNQGFGITMQEEEAADQVHGTEELGWIAILPGATTTSNGRRFENFSVYVTSDTSRHTFSTPFRRLYPTVITEIETAAGPDACFPRIRSLTKFDVELWLQEEQSLDPETKHLAEEVAIIAAD